MDNKKNDASHVKTIETLLKLAESGSSLVVVSSFVISEVRPYAEKYDANRLQYVEDLFFSNRPFIRVVGVTSLIARAARDLALIHRDLTNPDAIHLATALQERVDVFYTRDGNTDPKLKRRGLLRMNGKVGTPPLAIELPSVPIGPLFSGKPT